MNIYQKSILSLCYKKGGRYKSYMRIILPKVVLTDVDGVLTDGNVLYLDNGTRARFFNIRDGQGFKILKELGIKTGFVSGEQDRHILLRAQKLKLDIVLLGIQDKVSAVKKQLKKYSVSLKDVWFVGDDINDLELLMSVGLSFCPKNIPDDKVLKSCHFQLKKSGGHGVFRELVEIINLYV
ncbi:MAG: HAD hydrolase family protein [Elusimicrobiota bacterium]